MDAVVLSQVLDLLTKTGKNTDPAGASTLFAQLARIYAAVDQVEGYTDTLETILGLTTDSAVASGNVLQRLGALVAYTDSLETTVNAIKPKTDLIGAAADAAGTATLFGKIADAKAAAESKGDLSTYSNIQTPSGTVSLVTAGTWYSVLNMSGVGFLKKFIFSSSLSGVRSVRVTVDGVVTYLAKMDAANASAGWGIITEDLVGSWTQANADMRPGFRRAATWAQLGSRLASGTAQTNGLTPYPYTGNGLNPITLLPKPIFFNSSLIIEIMSDATANASLEYDIMAGVR